MIALSLLSCQCACLGPSGPDVDMAALTSRVAAVFEEPLAGTVADAPGDDREGVVFEPCAIADRPFDAAFEVSPAQCDDCATGTFGWTGELAVGGDAPLALTGWIEVWSEDRGLAIAAAAIDPPATGFPHQTFDVLLPAGALLEDAAVDGFEWGRRRSEDDAAVAVWEICALVAD